MTLVFDTFVKNLKNEMKSLKSSIERLFKSKENDNKQTEGKYQKIGLPVTATPIQVRRV